MIKKPALILFITTLLAVTGCSVVHTVPLAARPGDTIMVSVGSPNDLTRANSDITYTPSGGSPISIPDSYIRSIFNIYPDKNSAAWLYSDAIAIENQSGHGPWTTVIALDLPTPAQGITLPVGAGSIKVNTTATYNAPIPSANGVATALEILAGTAPSPSSFNYRGYGGFELSGDLSQLEPMKRLQFKPVYTGIDTSNTYAAVEVKIGLDKTGITEDDFNIIFDDKIGTTQSRNVSFFWKVSRFETTVYLMSPTGELQYSDVNFSIISTDLQNQFETGTQNVSANVTINSTTWYDIDGNVNTSGPAVTVVNLTGT